MTVPPKCFRRFDQLQQQFLQTAVGLRFYDEFLTQYGKHLFIFGTTGSGKTQKGYAFVDWMKYLETQIWFDSGKTNEILPLLCMDRKVRIITPSGADIFIEERVNGRWQEIQNHPQVIHASSPDSVISAIATGTYDQSRHLIKDTITIISLRNAFAKKELAISWVAEFFERLAERCRDDSMPRIFPASLHVDESQWAMAGKRISGEGERSKASEVITENALELRSAGIRLVLYAQGYTNIPPAARENMLFNVICRGGNVSSDENGNLSKWCNNAWFRTPPSPLQFRPHHGRFVFENGDSWPKEKPWNFRLYPVREDDRRWVKGLRIRYEGKHDRHAEQRETEEECIPELGRFSAMAIPPEKQGEIINRWSDPHAGGGIEYDSF